MSKVTPGPEAEFSLMVYSPAGSVFLPTTKSKGTLTVIGALLKANAFPMVKAINKLKSKSVLNTRFFILNLLLFYNCLHRNNAGKNQQLNHPGKIFYDINWLAHNTWQC